MHELGLTQEVLDVVQRETPPGARVRRVVLEIGALTAVLPDAIRFCFDICAEGTVADGAQLEIVETPGVARCKVCSLQFFVTQPFGQCPCGNWDLLWLSGDEFCITALEVMRPCV